MNTRLTKNGWRVNNRKKMRILKLNEIHQGDCLELMKDIPDGSIDMILCDLPYGTTTCSWDTIIPFEPLWEQYERIIKDDGAIVLTGTQPFTTLLIASNMKLFKYVQYWNKVKPSSFMNAKNAPMKKIEEVVVFSFGTIANGSNRLMKYNPQGLKISGAKRPAKNNTVPEGSTIGKRPSRNNGYIQKYTNYPSNLIEFSFEKHPVHPTQKPVPLFEYLIRTYTNEGDVVLDNCIGSGTTAIAALNTNRSFIGIEKEKEYVDIANERIKSSQLVADLS